MSFDVDQTYGALTPLVHAYADDFASAAADALYHLAPRVIAARKFLGPAHVLALTAAAARPVGRSAAVDAIGDVARPVMEHITSGAAWAELMDGEDRETVDAMRRLIYEAAVAVLCAAVVDDVLADAQRAAAYGPWEWAVAGQAPEPWVETDPDVLDNLRRQLAPLDETVVARLMDTAEKTGAGHDVEGVAADELNGVSAWPTGWAIVDRHGAPTPPPSSPVHRPRTCGPTSTRTRVNS